MLSSMLARVWCLALLLGASGCTFGSKAIEKTHGPYAAAVQRVDEEQLLKNIVRMRYVETPRALEITSIAAQYELSATAEARPFFSSAATSTVAESFSTVLPFAGVTGANRPTVTLASQDDGNTVRQFLTPISPETLVFLSQSGWPVSNILRIWVERMNGVPNWIPRSGLPRDVPPDYERFQRACELLQTAQDRELLSVHAVDRVKERSGPLPVASVTAEAVVAAAKDGFEYQPRSDAQHWVLVKKEAQLVMDVTALGKQNPEVHELIELLYLQRDRKQYDLVVATGVPDPAKNDAALSPDLRLTTRSTAQALFFLANGVEVPPEHAACGLVQTTPGVDPLAATAGVFRVYCVAGSSHKPPVCAYTAIWYRDHWYYIDDRDQASKATLLLMLQLRRLDFQKQPLGGTPALTLPVGK